MNTVKLIFAISLICQLAFGQSTVSVEKLVLFEKYNAARKTALAWVEREPMNSEAYLWAGKVFLAMGNLDSAQLFFDKGASVNPKSAYCVSGKIRVAFLKGDTEIVPKLAQTAKKIADGKDVRNYIELAEAFLYAKDETQRKQAVTFLAEAKKYDRKNYKIYVVLGDYYFGSSQSFSEAMENYRKATDYHRTALRPYLQRGAVYETIGNTMAAIDQYKKAIEIDPTFPVAYLRLAELLFRTKDFKGADTAYTAYLKFTEPAFDKLKRSAVIAFTAKNFKAAIPRIKQIIEADKQDASYLRLLAYYYYEENDTVASLHQFEKLMQSPDSILQSRDYQHYAILLEKFSMDSMAAIAY